MFGISHKYSVRLKFLKKFNNFYYNAKLMRLHYKRNLVKVFLLQSKRSTLLVKCVDFIFK